MKNKQETSGLIEIWKEIQDYIIPIQEEQLAQLQISILQEGCRDPLVVWDRDGRLILIDGHHRYGICCRYNVSFKIRKVTFKHIDDVRIWMIDNQLGRRNLSLDQMSYYRGLKYVSMRKLKGGYKYVQSKGQSDITTSEFLANAFHVSESTVKRDAKFAEGLNIIERSNPLLKRQILTGEVKVKKTDIQALASVENPEQIVIRNEADLYNKARVIQNSFRTVTVGDADVSAIKEAETADASQNQKPVFTDRSYRLRRIKGHFMSALNRAIRDADVDAIGELKKLIVKLEEELQNS